MFSSHKTCTDFNRSYILEHFLGFGLLNIPIKIMLTHGCSTHKTCILYMEADLKINFLVLKTKLTIYL